MIKVGERLAAARLQRGLRLEDVSSQTKIKTIFLEYIEKGEYEKLPSSSYAQGFVRSYARFLEISEDEILALFRREFDEEKNLGVLPAGLTTASEFSLSKIKTSQILLFLFTFLLLIGFIIFQYKDAIFGPSVTVSKPSENSKVTSTFEVVGKTDPQSLVFIDDFPVSVASDGSFRKSLSSFEGKQELIIKVVNRFQRQTVVKRHIEVKP